MHDIRAVRADPAAFDAALARRGLPPQSAAILEIDQKRRNKVRQLEVIRNAVNSLSRWVGKEARSESPFLSFASIPNLEEFNNTQFQEYFNDSILRDLKNIRHPNVEHIRLAVAAIKRLAPRIEPELKSLDIIISDLLSELPNVLDPDVPAGADETANVVV
ncbi:MAG: hypothetical protein JO047_10970, partial [Alphaproteobacteria bacterium]|nr:hypothetical protein [Alphaproteobacteria bacterium]